MAAIIWAPRALEDLESLVEFIARDSPVSAQRFASRLVRRVEALADQPDSGSWLPEDDRGIYRQIFQGPYRVIYRFDGERVFIVAVHHGSRLIAGEDLG